MAKAVTRYILMSPNKVRRIANMIRGKSVTDAEQLLTTVPHQAREVVAKTLKSAVANAESNEAAAKEDLRIRNIFVDEGWKLRRYLPRARGRADVIRKRTSHLTIVVEPAEETGSRARHTSRSRS